MRLKISATKERILERLREHYRLLRLVAPGLGALPEYPGEPHSDPILLPSSFDGPSRELYSLTQLADTERALRIGHGHDVLEELRRSLGIRSLLIRNAKAEHGTAANTRANEVVSRAEEQVNFWAAVYDRTWKSLDELGVTPGSSQGLQALHRTDDLHMLTTWLQEKRYRETGQKNLPWIWTLGCERMNVDPNDSDKVQEAIKLWNQEGMLATMVRPLCQGQLGLNLILFQWCGWNGCMRRHSWIGGKRRSCSYVKRDAES